MGNKLGLPFAGSTLPAPTPFVGNECRNSKEIVMIKQTTQSQSGNVIPFSIKSTPNPVSVHTGGTASKLSRLAKLMGRNGDKNHQAQVINAVSLLESCGMQFDWEQKTALLTSLINPK